MAQDLYMYSLVRMVLMVLVVLVVSIHSWPFCDSTMTNSTIYCFIYMVYANHMCTRALLLSPYKSYCIYIDWCNAVIIYMITPETTHYLVLCQHNFVTTYISVSTVIFITIIYYLESQVGRHITHYSILKLGHVTFMSQWKHMLTGCWNSITDNINEVTVGLVVTAGISVTCNPDREVEPWSAELGVHM